MVKYFDSIPRPLLKWIPEQKTFWVATAPLSEDGFVNISPKGVDGTFHVIDETRVWYEDLTGSGVATIAHVKENKRITVLFNAFEGPPQILRLYGKATVFEFGTPEYEEFLPADKRTCGSRSVIMIEIIKVATSCGFGVPFYTYRSQRNKLLTVSKVFERATLMTDEEREAISLPDDGSVDESETKIVKKGIKYYWKTMNTYSIDGLPALEGSFDSKATFCIPDEDWAPDDETLPSKTRRLGDVEVGAQQNRLKGGVRETDVKIVLAFLAGVLVTSSYLKLLKGVAI